ncbi:MAG: bifunctional UDP-sugar hydrolase/5'-nucleotidase [Rikenellaceae bacterium]
MKKTTRVLLPLYISVAALFFVIFTSQYNSKEQTFVILSTNDIHAQLTPFPALASAIEQCRDTVDVVLVDAGDRWTGNAFVDRIEYYTPIYELLNLLKYDVAIYGNHEFDKGQAYVATANRQAEFPIICANVKSETESFPQPAPFHIVKVGGKKIAFVGVVGNYEANGHPSGTSDSYEGLTFTDPHLQAAQYTHLADECDMLVLVSHSGLDRDLEFANDPSSKGYHQIISAHSHDVANEMAGGKLVTQTGSRLKNIGATTVTITRDGEVKLSYRNVPLSDYPADATVAKMVEEYYNNDELNASIGTAASDFTFTGLANLFTETIRDRVSADIGLYHSGGVRLEELAAGDISIATVLNVEPFGSCITNVKMNVEQLKSLIIAKFNDTNNMDESHRIDIITTTPYTVIIDASGEAVDVTFPELDESKEYKVAMGDYIFKTYGGLTYSSGEITDILITETIENHIKSHQIVEPNNIDLQNIVKQ